jgi:hypothetical protein
VLRLSISARLSWRVGWLIARPSSRWNKILKHYRLTIYIIYRRKSQVVAILLSLFACFLSELSVIMGGFQERFWRSGKGCSKMRFFLTMISFVSRSIADLTNSDRDMRRSVRMRSMVSKMRSGIRILTWVIRLNIRS